MDNSKYDKSLVSVGQILQKGVFKWLQTADILQLCTVSKDVGTLAQDYLFESPTFPNLFVFIQFLNQLQVQRQSGRNLGMKVRRLSLAEDSVVNGCCLGDLDQLLSLCPRLQSFRLEQGMHISNVLVQSIAENALDLKEVAFYSFYFVCHYSPWPLIDSLLFLVVPSAINSFHFSPSLAFNSKN